MDSILQTTFPSESNDGLGNWRIYAPLGLNELTLMVVQQVVVSKIGPW